MIVVHSIKLIQLYKLHFLLTTYQTKTHYGRSWINSNMMRSFESFLFQV
jgi:hypothetical protein